MSERALKRLMFGMRVVKWSLRLAQVAVCLFFAARLADACLDYRGAQKVVDEVQGFVWCLTMLVLTWVGTMDRN